MSEEKYKESRIMLCRYLFDIAREKGISQEEIARRTGFTQANVSRMLSGKYAPTLDNFLKLATAVDCFFFIQDKESDDDIVQLMHDRFGLSKSRN